MSPIDGPSPAWGTTNHVEVLQPYSLFGIEDLSDAEGTSHNSSDEGLTSSLVSTRSAASSSRLTLADIHIPAGFEIAKGLGENGTPYPTVEKIQKAAEVLQSLRGKLPSASDGQVAACDYCRRRKIKCDRIKPTCGSCTQSGKKCTTEDMLRKRGPPSKREKAILEAAGIIFRGTRPHRRRRTTMASMRSVSQEPTRARANSTNSKPITEQKPKNWWMEMLSVATDTPNPFSDSPEPSPAGSSTLDAGACDYLTEGAIGGPDILHESTHAAKWDNMWATFGDALRQRHSDHPHRTTTGGDDDKSIDAGALDWSNGTPSIEAQTHHFVPLGYQLPQLVSFNDQNVAPWERVLNEFMDSPINNQPVGTIF